MSSQSAIAKAWRWSVLHSPLLYGWRWVVNTRWPNHHAEAVIRAAGLPAPVGDLIARTVRKTRLWSGERGQVARELIAHARDALESGRTGEEIIATFGKPPVVARLLRRSMKRKRPIPWQMYRQTRRLAWMLILLLIAGYATLAVRFYTGRPNIKRDYIAELNARNAGYTEDQKSWPVLAEVGHEWDMISYALKKAENERITTQDRPNRSEGMNLFPDVDSTHPDYEEIVDAVRGLGPQLARLREAAARPVFGMPIGYETEQTDADGKTWTVGIVPAEADEYIEHSVIEVLLPNLGWARNLSNVLVFDARLAMIEGDPRRAVDDLGACMGLARQCDQQPFMISRLVGIAIQDMVGVKLNEMLVKYPGTLSRDQLIKLAHNNALLNQEWGIGLESERVAFGDMLQRIYTDDGEGDGHLTARGLELAEPFMGRYSPWGSSGLGEVLLEDQKIRAATLPLVLAGSDGRKTERGRHEAFIDDLERVMAEGPESIGRLALREAEFERHQSHSSAIQFSLADLMTPAITNAVERSFHNRQTGEALGVMLALELYRLDRGRIPDSLGQLVPQYLPRTPQDIMDPGQPIKYKRLRNGYILYSVGSDGDDDGGTEPDPAPNERMQLGLRYALQIEWINGEPRIQPDAQGNPTLRTSDGPDSDWILIDMRPEQN